MSEASLVRTHSNYSYDWWTPPEWLDWVSKTLGTDDWFDPCPKDWDPSQPSGLDVPWGNATYCNHPGARNSAARWWAKWRQEYAQGRAQAFVWCAFSVEQFRRMAPSALEMPGWLVLPKERLKFIWGGPDFTPKRGQPRRHGEPIRSPSNWAGFWCTRQPAKPPVDSFLVSTGDVSTGDF